MSLYANEGGTLKNMSPSDSGSFKITGIDYFGEYMPSSDKFTIQLSKALGSYKYLIILGTREPNAKTSNPNVGDIPVVISVSKFLETAITGSCFQYHFPVMCSTSSGALAYMACFTGVESVTSTTTSLMVSTRSSNSNLIYECYGVF